MKNPCEEPRECIGKLRYAKNRSEEEVVEFHDRALAAVEVVGTELEARARHDNYADSNETKLKALLRRALPHVDAPLGTLANEIKEALK